MKSKDTVSSEVDQRVSEGWELKQTIIDAETGWTRSRLVCPVCQKEYCLDQSSWMKKHALKCWGHLKGTDVMITTFEAFATFLDAQSICLSDQAKKNALADLIAGKPRSEVSNFFGGLNQRQKRNMFAVAGWVLAFETWRDLCRELVEEIITDEAQAVNQALSNRLDATRYQLIGANQDLTEAQERIARLEAQLEQAQREAQRSRLDLASAEDAAHRWHQLKALLAS